MLIIVSALKDPATIGLFFTVTLISACGAGTNTQERSRAAGAQPPYTAPSPGGDINSAGPTPSASDSVGRSYSVINQEDSMRLQQLWVARTAHDSDAVYPVGPGDVLEVNAQYVPELRNKIVRVAGDGTFYLPLLGDIRAAGLSEEELSAEIATKLRKYIYTPEVEVFVRKYHSHQVAVIGAVKT